MIDFSNRDSMDGKTKICDVLEDKLQMSINRNIIEDCFIITEIEVQGIKIKGYKIKDGSDLKTSIERSFSKEKATVVIDESGHIYYKDKKSGLYVFDSTITNIEKYKKIFETLKANEE